MAGVGIEPPSRIASREELILEAVPPPEGLATAGEGPFASLVSSVARSSGWTGMAIADRVHSDEDSDPLDVACKVAPMLGRFPLVHVAGKDRTAEQGASLARRFAEVGAPAALLMTGDRIKDRQRESGGRVPYADSVNLVETFCRHAPAVRRGVVVNPFKTAEEDLRNQLLKLRLKVAAGASEVTTQIGFSWEVLASFANYAGEAHPGLELRATVCYLSRGIARVLGGGTVPGVILAPSLLQEIEAEATGPSARHHYAMRAAVQIAGMRSLGYRSVQVACITSAGVAERISDALEELEGRQLGRDGLAELWKEWIGPTLVGPPLAEPAAVQASLWEKLRYRVLDSVDHAMFAPDDPRGARTSAALRRVSRSRSGRRVIQVVEESSKGLLVGCRMCGFCRLPETMYVCPETCPKGLANGPCGGTSEGTCEFGDRECIHNRKYRTAVAVGRVEELAGKLIPPVPERIRGSSSWVNHAEGRDPVVARLGDPAASWDARLLDKEISDPSEVGVGEL